MISEQLGKQKIGAIIKSTTGCWYEITQVKPRKLTRIYGKLIKDTKIARKMNKVLDIQGSYILVKDTSTRAKLRWEENWTYTK